MPTYQTACPNSSQSPGILPPQANANWIVLQDEINRDHIFNDTPNAIPSTDNSGTHRQVTLTDRLDPVAPLPAGTNGIVYLKDGKVSYFNGTTYFRLAPVLASVTFDTNGVILGTAFNATVTKDVPNSRYTITFTNALPNIFGQFSIIGWGVDANNPTIAKIDTFTTAAMTVRFVNQNSSVLTTITSANLIIFGG
jgi:hypothetical protein